MKTPTSGVIEIFKKILILLMEVKTIGPNDEYEMREKIGQGAYGKVYKAFHKNTRTVVAIKRLPKESDNQEFRREIETLRILNSEYIIKYYTSCFRLEEFWVCYLSASVGHSPQDRHGVLLLRIRC